MADYCTLSSQYRVELCYIEKFLHHVTTTRLLLLCVLFKIFMKYRIRYETL